MTGAPAFSALLRREVVRFVRQPSRIVATIGTPLLLWAFLAGGFADSLAPRGDASVRYGAFLLPGMATAVVLFSSIFAAMSLIEDRRAGFLQSVLVSPAPRWSIALAKAGGGALVATAQAAVILLAAPLVGARPGAAGAAIALLAVALTSVALTSLGLAAAWKVNSSEGFHGVMNLVLMPMWMLSGAFFDPAGAAPWMRALMAVNPLRWATDAVRGPLAGVLPWSPGGAPPWAVTLAFALAMLGLASATIGRGRAV